MSNTPKKETEDANPTPASIKKELDEVFPGVDLGLGSATPKKKAAQQLTLRSFFSPLSRDEVEAQRSAQAAQHAQELHTQPWKPFAPAAG